MALRSTITDPADYTEKTVDVTILPLSITDLRVTPPTWEKRGRVRVNTTRTVHTWVACTGSACDSYIANAQGDATKKWNASFEKVCTDTVIKSYNLIMTIIKEEREYTSTDED